VDFSVDEGNRFSQGAAVSKKLLAKLLLTRSETVRLATGREVVASPNLSSTNGADTKRRNGTEVGRAAQRVLPVELGETSPPRFLLVRLSAYGPAPAAPYVVEVLGPQRERPIETDYAVLEVS